MCESLRLASSCDTDNAQKGALYRGLSETCLLGYYNIKRNATQKPTTPLAHLLNSLLYLNTLNILSHPIDACKEFLNIVRLERESVFDDPGSEPGAHICGRCVGTGKRIDEFCGLSYDTFIGLWCVDH